ncbi:hypothetical protein [Rudaea sp.]|uniref:hypothetical protein n=1 Tax=Rudaea sp. TaxID=2136325 RepID=UPI002ECFC43C
MRRYLWIAAIVIAALAAGWWFGRNTAPARGTMAARSAGADTGKPGVNNRSDASKYAATHVQSSTTANRASTLKPLPPPGTPLKTTFADLQTRANAGDGAAATRLYRDLATCAYSRSWIRSESMAAKDILDQKTDGQPIQAQQSQLDRAQFFLDRTARWKALCVDVGQNTLDTLSSAALQAAQLGDANARDCYVHRGPGITQSGLINSPESINTYREQVPALIDSAIADGDWKMVDMLQHAYSPSGNNLIAGLLGPDPVQHYRYLKLFRLGANGYMIQKLDKDLAYAGEQISTEQRMQADAWALTTQQAYFHGNSTEAAPSGWDACVLPVE